MWAAAPIATASPRAPAPAHPASPAARARRRCPTGRRHPPADHKAQSVPNGARLRCQIVADTETPVAGLREEEIESRWEAAPAVGIVIAMQLVLASVSRNQAWQLWVFPWWVWLIPIVPELLLLLPLAWRRPRRRLEQLGNRR